ncbi:MAG TPA: hypothetical protein VHX64_16725 [Caulobacteraceae bacterium]|nr:hypothetical protein [Caulobacteraceae bacterium]
MHLGLTGETPPELVEALWASRPTFSIGHALPRRDVWRRIAAGLEPIQARNLPHDPGVLAYLTQLDLDLLLLAAPARDGEIEADYLIAARRLKLPAAELGASSEAVLAQAQPNAVAAPAAEPAEALQTPLLWARLAWDMLTVPPEAHAAATSGRKTRSLWRRLQDDYAKGAFPALASAPVALAPAARPLLKARLSESLDPDDLANEAAAEAAMAEAAEGDGAIVLGPWWGEPEIEILYWAPFLRWWRRRYTVDKARLVVVSSGGAGPWYEGVTSQYLDLSELYEPGALAELQAARLSELEARRKHFGLTDADRQVLKRLDRRTGFRGLRALPPWTMAVIFDRYWSGRAGPALLNARTRAQTLQRKLKLARPLARTLPSDYLAVGLDAGAADPSRQAAFEALVRRAAEQTPVVILAEPDQAPDAQGLAASGPGMQVFELEPATAKQTATTVVAAARAWLGPQTWMAHAAAATGRPSICLRLDDDLRRSIHAASAARLFDPPPLVVNVRDLDALSQALSLVVAAPASEPAAH